MELATVQSDEDRAKLKEAANAVNCTSDAWIGFKRVTWRWSYQHTPMSYKKWDYSQPDLSQTDWACGSVKYNRQWGDSYCSGHDNFFCQTGKRL